MSINDLYFGLVTNKFSLSEGLALVSVYVPLSSEERLWVNAELNGYNDKTIVPDYRKLSCEVKARIQNLYSGVVEDIDLVGKPIEDLEAMLNSKLGLSVYKLYVCQGVESIEQLVKNHNDGDIIMKFEGAPSSELKSLLSSNERVFNFKTIYVFQTAPVAYLMNALSVIKNRLFKIMQSHLAQEGEKDEISKDDGTKKKKVIFISYCWESDEHKAWVKKLADDLSDEFTVRIDQKLPFGVELTKFMEEAVATSDKVLIIATPEYKRKADNRIRGVGYETSLITDDLVTDQNKIKFIPIIRKGSKETSYPRFLGSKNGADMTNDSRYAEVLSELKRNLRDY